MPPKIIYLKENPFHTSFLFYRVALDEIFILSVKSVLSQVFGAEFLLSLYDFVFSIFNGKVNLTEAKTLISNDILK